MYLGFQGLRAIVQRLPLSMARSLGRSIGRAAYGVLPAYRRLAEEHLGYAMGEALSVAARRQVTRGVFRHLGQTAVEWLWLPAHSDGELNGFIVSEGIEHLRAALARGNGVIALTGHVGNWEMIPLYLRSLGFQGGVLARRLRYPEYESFLIRLRGARGVPTLARGSLKEVATLLRANQIVGVLPDQDVDSLEGIFVDFFGHPTYTPVGPAALSLMTAAPIVPCFMIREGSRFRLVIEPALPTPSSADRKQAMAALTQAWSRVVESYIRRYPEQWVWMHRRWKTQPTVVNSGQWSVVSGQPHKGEAANASEQIRTAVRQRPHPAWLLLLLVTGHWSLVTVMGCGKPPKPSATEKAEWASDASQKMSGFTLTGYEEDGRKR